LPEPDLLVTKFTIPPLRSVLLHRSHLLEVLEQSRSVPLTLLSAGAGFGKTTLLSAWAQQDRQNTGHVAWLSLDEQDSDPTGFWTYVIAALRHSGPRLSTVGEAALAMLHSPQPPLLTSALTSLINELAALAQDTALILDDYHLIGEQAIHESLQFVLDHLPACLHLLLASRVDPPLPLARLRVRGHLVEIRDSDLRLDSTEAASFLKEVMKIALSEQEMHLLEKRTEGWIAGLQLAALSMRRHDDMSAFLKAFRGSHRLILDYVQEEILEPLPERQHRFLLRTSVLERMNAEVCQAVTGEQASQQMLEELERANLFLIPLDEERLWYRWHALFREVLLARLQATEPEQVVRLYREAALWFQRQGWVHEAISHAKASQDFWFVAELLEGCAERLYRQGELQTLLAWIKLLPLEVLRAHPRLATSYILAFYVLFPFSPQQQEEQAYLQQLRAGVEQALERQDQTTLSQAERDRLRHRLTILDSWERVAEALSEGNVEQLSSLAEQVQDLPPDDDHMWQQHRLAPFPMAWRMAGNFPPVVRALQEMGEMARMMQNPYQEVQACWGLIIALIALGQLSQAYEHCETLHQLVTRLGEPLPIAAYPDVFRAQVAYAWNHLEVAKSKALIAIEKTAPLQYMDILMPAYEVLARACLALGDLTGAEQALYEMEQVNKQAAIPLFRPWVESLQVLLWLAQDNLTRAVEWAEHTPYLEEVHFYSRENAALALVRVYLAQQKYAPALQLLAALQGSAEHVARVGSIIAILALQIAALQASGASQEALDVLLHLLTLAEPEGYVRVFLDAGEPMEQALHAFLASDHRQDGSAALVSYVQTLLEAFALEQHQAPAQQAIPIATPSPSGRPSHVDSSLPEPLTAREQEVLRLLAQGATNQEIADHLVVSLRTVKKHVGNLLLKLDAQNRTHAVARAREFSLL
jgi:LuxR family maltose regulon positive regulatory protein